MSLLRANWSVHNRLAQQLDRPTFVCGDIPGTAFRAAGHRSRAREVTGHVHTSSQTTYTRGHHRSHVTSHEVTAPVGGVSPPPRSYSIVSERYMFFRLISGQAPSMRYFHCVERLVRGRSAAGGQASTRPRQCQPYCLSRAHCSDVPCMYRC